MLLDRSELLLHHLESCGKTGSKFSIVGHYNENRLLIPVQIE
jgi:hypothetical protein